MTNSIKISYSLFFSFVFSVSIFFYSEISILAIIFIAFPLLWKFNIKSRILLIIFLTYSFIFLGKFYDFPNDILRIFSYFFIAFSIFLVFDSKKIENLYLFRIALLSLISISAISLYLSSNYTSDIKLKFESINVKNIFKDDIFTLIPENNVDSWGFFNFDLQGSGEIEVEFEIRSNTPITINIGLLHFDLPKVWNYNSCRAENYWKTCKLTAKLRTRNILQLGIGGWATWKSTDSTIKVRNIRLNVIKAPAIFEYFELIRRFKAFSFNENAFGAQIVVGSLLIIVLRIPLLWKLFATIPTMLCIVMTGSRGSLISFTIGLIVFFFLGTRYYKILLWVLILGFFGVISLQNSAIRNVFPSINSQTQPILRSFDVTDQNSTRTRLEIWRLATKAWLENPRTFLIGTGDLTTAMKAKFDARSSSFGLTKDSLTHAHNLWIQTAGESGLVGLCAMLWLWGWVILRAWRSRDAGALALLAAIFVINSVDYLFFYAPVHLAFWMAAAGLKRPEPTPVLPEASAILTP